MTDENRPRTPISADWVLKRIQEGKKVRLENAIIEGDLDISKLDLPIRHIKQEMRGWNADAKVIQSSIEITNSTVQGTLNFNNIIFSRNVGFEGTTFSGRTEFHEAIFVGDARFNRTGFGTFATRFSRTTFSGNVGFDGATFSTYAGFHEAIFVGDASFAGTTFSGKVEFHEATFSGFATFNDAAFIGDARFDEATFNGYAGFGNATFSRAARFSGTTFNREAGFQQVTFGMKAYFNGATFGGEIRFSSATFSGNVGFDGATFSTYAGFHEAIFVGEARFDEATFRGETKFIKTTFRGDVTFFGTQFDQNLSLNGARYEHAYIHWDTIKDHLEYQEATNLTLIENFKKLGFFEDVDACYYQYRKVAQIRKPWYDWSKLLDIIAWVTCGYGVKIWRPVLCVMGCAIIFASLYGLFNGITNVGSSEISSLSINIAPIIIQNTHPIEVHAGEGSWVDYFYFSTAALTGSTPTELRPLGPWKYAVMIEHLIGYMFLALFIVVLTKKMIR